MHFHTAATTLVSRHSSIITRLALQSHTRSWRRGRVVMALCLGNITVPAVRKCMGSNPIVFKKC